MYIMLYILYYILICMHIYMSVCVFMCVCVCGLYIVISVSYCMGANVGQEYERSERCTCIRNNILISCPDTERKN